MADALPFDVTVIGGGVAGIAASVALADAGLKVQLLEKRAMLGGRASSWTEHTTGQPLDACQHGTMRCCTNLANLLDRLGVHHLIRYDSILRFLDADGIISILTRGPLPAPLHTGMSFLAFRALGPRDKLGIAKALLSICRTNDKDMWIDETFGSWLRRKRQTRRALDRFWEPIVVSACNESIEKTACRYALKVFRDGFLANSTGYEFGIPTVPLGVLYTEPARRFIESRGGQVRSKTTVSTIQFHDGIPLSLTLMDGEVVPVSSMVSGLQHDLLLKYLPREVLEHAYFSKLLALQVRPLMGVHLWFDKLIDCPEALALLDRSSDWVFNKTTTFGLDPSEGTYLSVVISADPELTAMKKEDVLERVLKEIHEALPTTKSANLTKWYVLKEHKGTFAPLPKVEAMRPDQRSPIRNLYVAGEWTRTGWPSTMESAARSGFLAAEKLLEDMGRPARYLVPDLPRTGLSRWLMR